MTKEEVIKDLIDMAKNGVNNPLDAYCDSCSCLTCPFHSDENGECPDVMVGELIGALIKAEEHQETNLEHFRGTVVFDKANGIVHIHLINGWGKSYSDDKGAIEWLLAPYEEPKPKFKLTQFEYDLLSSANPTWAHENDNTELCDFGYLTRLIDKDYFKGIPTDVPIRDILANCEVVEE